MEDEQKSQNKRVKAGLDIFLQDEEHDYSQPFASKQDFYDRGLVTPEGLATGKGELFAKLQQAGMMEGSGALTSKGLAYKMPYAETLSKENLSAFLERKTDGIDEQEGGSFGEMAGAVGDMVWNTGAALNKAPFMFSEAVGNYFSPWNAEKSKMESGLKLGLAATSAVEGSIEATQQLVQLADMGTALAATGLFKIAQMDDEAKVTLGVAQQDMARTNYELKTRGVGETIEALTGITGPKEMAQAATEHLPQEVAAKVATQFDALGQFVDPTILIPGGVAAKAAKVGVTTRVALKADSILVRAAIKDAEVAAKSVALESAKRAVTTSDNVAATAFKMKEEIGTRFEQTGDQVLAQRAKLFGEVGERASLSAQKHSSSLASLAAELEAATLARSTLASRIPEAAAMATQRAFQIGQAVSEMPFAAVSKVAEAVGSKLVAANNALTKVSESFGMGAASKIIRTGIGFAGYAAGGVPGVATAGAILGAGPVLESVSKFSRLVGKEMTRARGQIPFWQRVANYSENSTVHRGLSHLMDTATMGGAIPNVARRVGRGTLAAMPIDLAFTALADGGEINTDTFKKALAQSLVIGGSSGMLGGMLHGTKKLHQELALGDEKNFREDMDDLGQKQAYEQMPPGVRRSIATYAASNPQLIFKFTDQGTNSFSENVATINVNSPNPMHALIAHEVMHHVVIRNQNEEGVLALMLGDGETGGILRSNDGTLDANFKEFKTAYDARLVAEGRKPTDMRRAAMEYYVDAAATHFAEMADSGELGVISSQPKAARAISSIVRATAAKIPIIRDLHFKMGGQMDGDGVMVQGNGLLADGIRESREMRAMTQEMLRRSSGRSQGGFVPFGSSKGKEDAGGATLRIAKGDKAMTDQLISIAETKEVDGKAVVQYTAAGEIIPISPATDSARSNASKVILEAIRTRQASGLNTKSGEMTADAAGNFKGNYLGDDVIRKMHSAEIGNSAQRRLLVNINNAIKDFSGHRFTMVYHPATKKIGKRVVASALAPTLRDAVPVAIRPTAQGNLLVHLMSVTQLKHNMADRLATKRGHKLYSGDAEALMNDVAQVMELHRQDKTTTAYFQEKYGASRALEYKGFVNTLFGLMTPEMQEINPLFQEDRVSYKHNVYKTYRWDRIDKAVQMTGENVRNLPFVYGSAKHNLMPNGLPTLDFQGVPVVQKYQP